MHALTNPYFVAILSPMGLLVLGTIGKGIIKGEIDRFVFFMGFEASLTAVYANVVYLLDLAHDMQTVTSQKLIVTGVFLIVAFLMFLLTVFTHQMWERPHKCEPAWKQIVVLGILMNIVGIGLLVAFVLLVKGVA